MLCEDIGNNPVPVFPSDPFEAVNYWMFSLWSARSTISVATCILNVVDKNLCMTAYSTSDATRSVLQLLATSRISQYIDSHPRRFLCSDGRVGKGHVQYVFLPNTAG